jgi:hypothetical protein
MCFLRALPTVVYQCPFPSPFSCQMSMPVPGVQLSMSLSVSLSILDLGASRTLPHVKFPRGPFCHLFVSFFSFEWFWKSTNKYIQNHLVLRNWENALKSSKSQKNAQCSKKNSSNAPPPQFRHGYFLVPFSQLRMAVKINQNRILKPSSSQESTLLYIFFSQATSLHSPVSQLRMIIKSAKST